MNSMKPMLGQEGAGKRALITGSAGFTGRYVAQELRAAGYQVSGIVAPGSAAGLDTAGAGTVGLGTVGVRSVGAGPVGVDTEGVGTTGVAAGGVEEFSVDLNDRAGLAAVVAQVRPDVVVHLAAIAFVGHGDVEQLYRVNLLGTRNLLEALAGLAQPPAAVLLASSANVYGNTDVGVIDEDVPAAPANDYAVSKLAMEVMARLWCDRLPLTVVRPFNYTGVGQDQHFLLPKIVAHFRRRDTSIELGNLQVWRDFSDVRVVARNYRRLLAAPAAVTAGRTFNICSGTATSLGEVLDLMAGIAGYRIAVRVNPAFMRANEVVRLVGDNRRLAAVIGAPGPLDAVPLAATLRWMVEA